MTSRRRRTLLALAAAFAVALGVVVAWRPARTAATWGLVRLVGRFAKTPLPAPTGPVVPRLFALQLQLVNGYAVRAGDALLLFDAGLPGLGLAEELAKVGLRAADVTHVFLTHSDWDHVGGLPLLTGATVYLPAAEEPLATGVEARGGLGLVHNERPARPWTLVRPGERVAAGTSTVEVVATPGHTTGSTSYVVDGRWLFVGDAAGLSEGRATPPPWIFAQDPAAAEASLRRLAALPGLEVLATGHAGYTTAPAAALAQFFGPPVVP